MFGMYVCICATHMSGAFRGQRRCQIHWKWSLQVVMNAWIKLMNLGRAASVLSTEPSLKTPRNKYVFL